ncbi:ASCH domain-containing protein [Streptococcus caprae]|uniref:ASCH domain-containing protein n=1 Tax=Streptococcus caprae TaxID=1640501 RepID=A0ABV8CTK8_9STRE
MTPEDMWQAYKTINPNAGDDYEAWAFGLLEDELAQLVLDGVKTATASGYDLYALEDEPLPSDSSYNIILDSQGNAVCVTKQTKVYVTEFCNVTAEHAYKEGEGDRSLAYWRQVHEDFFKPYYEEAGLTFSENSKIVCEEFEVVYPLT